MKTFIGIVLGALLVLNVILTTIFMLAGMYAPAAFQVACFVVNSFTFWRHVLDDDDDLKFG